MEALTTHFDLTDGTDLLLPASLAEFYGRLSFAVHPDRPHVITNFVSSLDGVVTLAIPGYSGGGDISGFNPSDKAVMGLLRAAAGAVIVGASQLRRPPGTIWTPEHICPDYADAYFQLREALGLPKHPLQIIVSASAKLDYTLPIFQTEELPVLLLTTSEGARTASKESTASSINIQVISNSESFSSRQILSAIQNYASFSLLLIEAGPHMVSRFFDEQALDEIFLTVSPLIAGRKNNETQRMGFISGIEFAPFRPLWGRMKSIKQADAHLFLRYEFPAS